ncbi:MAG: N-6 DNA methylase, partial [Myxococcota bacterium]|nr:N-6 DNA methylase [Myxococcota bacterium]
FYTPQELVDLVLDAAGFEASREGLCRCAFIDPASGSGTFVASALRRLLAHLDLALPCHAEANDPSLPPWRRAELLARLAAKNAHAVDIHPFAAFLTTVNMLFQLLPYYMEARRKNREFTLSLNVFTADSLEPAETQGPSADQVEMFNSRIRHAEDSARRYRERITGRRFDLVVGNPPWGGVLKGSLAPVFDDRKKQRLRERFPASTEGKFDIYGPFIEHAMEMLADDGRFALVTQGSYFDKDWAGALRARLSAECRLDRIIDLNPFGQLLFGATNIPAVTVATRGRPAGGNVQVVLGGPPAPLRAVPEAERRAKLMEAAWTASRSLERRASHQGPLARGYRVPRKEFAAAGRGRWPVTGPPGPALEVLESYQGRHLLDFVEPFQGVTPGGVLDLFLMREEDAAGLKLERALVYRALKSRDLGKWRVEWDGRVILYPYLPSPPGYSRKQATSPAFRITDRERARMPAELRDALDFETRLDDREAAILRRHGLTDQARREILDHRIAAGIVHYPEVARHLTVHYERLSGRVFEKKNIRAQGKQWYEYHRPRSVDVMLQRPRLLCPGLAKHVRFVLDEVGHLSDDACFVIVHTERTARAFESVQLRLVAAVPRRTITRADVLRYILAFANSSVADELLRHGRRPRPGDVYQYDEAFLREIPVPDPPIEGGSTAKLIALVESLTDGTAKDAAAAEAEVDAIARSILEASRGASV